MRRSLGTLLAVVLILGAVPLLAAARSTGVMAPGLRNQLKTADPAAQLLVFVHAGGDLAVASRALALAGLEPVSTWDSIGVAVGAGTPAELRAVTKAPGVTYVEGDQPLAYTMQTSHIATRGRQTRTYGPFLTATGASQIDGRGVSVAVIDSGIDSRPSAPHASRRMSEAV